MTLLIVEGNAQAHITKQQQAGATPSHQRFKSMLKFLVPGEPVDVVHPSDADDGLPNRAKLNDYRGVLWTGSAMNIYQRTPEITRQLTFAADLFASGVPWYGSCWGAQLATVVAGGTVASSANGREFAIAHDIQLTHSGRQHRFFAGRRSAPFSAFCIHQDEIIEPADNSTILASNSHSPVQALSIEHLGGTFFGVQYHPEFLAADMLVYCQLLRSAFLAEGLFDNPDAINEYRQLLQSPLRLPDDVSNYRVHTQEVAAWLADLR